MNLKEAISTLQQLLEAWPSHAAKMPLLSSVQEAIQIVIQDLAAKESHIKEPDKPTLEESCGALKLDQITVNLICHLLKYLELTTKIHEEKTKLTAVLTPSAKYVGIRRVLKL